MDDHAGRLHQDYEVVILEEDLEREIFGRCS